MDIVKVKGYTCAVISIIILTALLIVFYNEGITSIKGIWNKDDYLYFDPKLISLFIALPVIFYFDLLCLCIVLPFKTKSVAFMQKLMIPMTIYGVFALVIGFVISLIISFYPLGTDYYKCHSTSIVSSGSSYAKSKEICKQRGSDSD